MADLLIAYMESAEAPLILGHVAKAQIDLWAFGVDEIGFWQRIAEHALR